MILYHGTSVKYLPSILRDGLLPREKTGNSNWQGKVISKPNLVYLTTAYPIYFALCVSDATQSDLVILQCRVRRRDLFPDEDFLAYVAYHSGKYPGKTLEELGESIDPTLNKHLAEDSLNYNGVAAIRQVNPSRILNHVVISKSDMRTMMIGGDSMPIPMNYRFLGQNYAKAINILFEKGIDAACEHTRKMFCF